MKKVISCMICALLLVGCMAGCGSTGGTHQYPADKSVKLSFIKSCTDASGRITCRTAAAASACAYPRDSSAKIACAVTPDSVIGEAEDDPTGSEDSATIETLTLSFRSRIIRWAVLGPMPLTLLRVL